MSDSYIDPPITADYDATVAAALDAMAAAFPGWTPRESHLEVALVEIIARMNAETADVASRLPRSIFRYFGQSVLGLAPIDAARSRIRTTWTLRDILGHTIVAGTVLAFSRAADQQVFFEVEQDVVVPPGTNATSAGAVTLVALEEGSSSNGIPSNSTINLVDALSWVDEVKSTTVSSGGVDAESDADYLNRLTAELRLLTPRPILAPDFAVLAQRTPGVGRAIAIDNYNPAGGGSFGWERMVTVAVADENGQEVAPQVRQAVADYLDALREVNFIVHVINPTYADIDVTASVRALPGADPVAVADAAKAALQNYLNPGTWAWTKVVRRNELIALLDRVDGVDYVLATSPTIPAADIQLPGAAPLPRARNILVNVV